MHFSAKKLFLIGFVFLLLVGIPATVYLVQQQQETRSRAAPATTLSFSPATSQGEPKQLTKEDPPFPFDIMVDPGTNVVTLVKLEIDYDPDKIQIVKDSFQPNTAIMSISAGPVYSSNSFSVTLSAGFDPNKAIQVKQRIGTIKVRALATTDPDSPTRITFSSSTDRTLITSLGSTDQASENVFNAGGSSPAFIAIAEASSPTDVPTEAPTEAPTDTPSPSNSGTNPVCSSLTADTTSGQSPLGVNFTAAGTSVDPNTVSKVTFNFGDGQVSDVTTGGGIGTNSVNVQLSHTYSTAGTFQASAILTDNVNGVSDTTNCSQTITVAGANATAEPATATPTLAPTGPTEVMIGIGAVAGFLMIGGALLFFLL